MASLPLKRKFDEVDYYGAFFLLPAVVCLLLALQWGGTVYAWNSSRIIGLFVGFGIMILIFIAIQIYRGDKATLPLSVLKQRTVASACLFLFFEGAALFVLIYYSILPIPTKLTLVPIYFQAVKGSSPSESGLQLLPLMLSVVIMGFIAGIIVTLWGYYTPFIIAGAAIFTIGAGLITTFTVDQADWRAYGFTIVAGIGCGMALQNAFMSIQVVLPQATLSVGNAAVMFSQTLSGAVFLAVSQSVLSNGLVSHIQEKIPDLDPAMIVAAGATGIRNLVTAEQLPLVLEAYNSAVRDVFIMAVALGGASFIATLGFEWKSIKGKNLLASVA